MYFKNSFARYVMWAYRILSREKREKIGFFLLSESWLSGAFSMTFLCDCENQQHLNISVKKKAKSSFVSLLCMELNLWTPGKDFYRSYEVITLRNVIRFAYRSFSHISRFAYIQEVYICLHDRSFYPATRSESICLLDLSPTKSFRLHWSQKYFAKIDEQHCVTISFQRQNSLTDVSLISGVNI